MIKFYCWLVGLALALVGALLVFGGVQLALLGGSTYYLLAGLACFVSGALVCLRRRLGAHLYTVTFLATFVWSVWEVGMDGWQLLPRLGGPFVFLLLLLPCWARLPRRQRSLRPAASAAVAISLLGASLYLLIAPRPSGALEPGGAQAGPLDWAGFGGSAKGTRFSQAAQITRANVKDLELAWSYRTGDMTPATAKRGDLPLYTFQATPLNVGDSVYLCTPHNKVVALDADNGKPRWTFDPKIDGAGIVVLACRGVAYYRAPPGTIECPERIMVATLDARLIALDAATGRPCPSFGKGGEVALSEGLSPTSPALAHPTSPPTIVGNAAILGGFVLDNVARDVPAGVVRAYDARDGKILWTWDSGRDDDAAPAPGAGPTRGSPNAWAPFSADEALGLVFVPTGNAAPDYFGGLKTARMEKYGSSVVALDVATGKPRWAFQTTHHDLWDHDVGSQPVLADLKIGGKMTPALIQPTKHGDIFVLDRRTGQPLTQVVERPMPAGDVPGEHYSPTQPVSQGMPRFTPPALTEASMWGATPLDQMLCRIRFRKLRYDGEYTPPSLQGSILYPGNFGVIDWGSVSVDERRGIMLVNASYLPMVAQLVPRADAGRITPASEGLRGSSPQAGTPYVVNYGPMFSPIGLPCNAPPWGTLSAVDLASRKVVWTRRLGTTSDHAPFGIAVPGVFNLGGAVTTDGGVVFIAATIDRYLRAFDRDTGRELWRGRLPAGGQAGAMTYVSRRSGRQFVVIAAGGHALMGTTPGDYVLAYALPAKPR